MVVVTGGYPSVSQTFVLREIKAAIESGWKVHVVSPTKGGLQDTSQAIDLGLSLDNITYLDWRVCVPRLSIFPGKLWKAADVKTYGRFLSLRRMNFFRQLMNVNSIRKSDLIHCHFVQWAREVGVGLSTVAQKPLTVEAHDSHLNEHSSDTLMHVQETASMIGCVSNNWIDLWESKTGTRENLVWIPNGVEPNDFDNQKRTDSTIPTIINVGNCIPRKRPQDLLYAAKPILEKGIKFKLKFVGGGDYLSGIINLAAQLDISAHCEFLGAQPHSVVRSEMSKSDIFCLCSEQESFGIVTVEAMASSLPTVVSETAGAKDIVIKGETGFTFPVGNISQLTSHLERLLTNYELRNRLGQNGRMRAIQVFSWERHMQLVNEMWCSALDKYTK